MTPHLTHWTDDDPTDDDFTYPDTPTVYDTDPTLIGILYSPTGDVLSRLYDRPVGPIGFTRQTDRPTQWERA